MNDLLFLSSRLPPVLQFAEPMAYRRVLEFFTANIRNANTRRAYFGASVEFLDWCGERERAQTLTDLHAQRSIRHFGLLVDF